MTQGWSDVASALAGIGEAAKPLRITGRLGDPLTGTVKVDPDDTRVYWCRVNDGENAEEVVNSGGVPPVYGAVVVLEKQSVKQASWEIARAGLDAITGEVSSSAAFSTRQHGLTHANDGTDPILVDLGNLRYPFGRIVPVLVGGSPSTSVLVQPFVYEWAGQRYVTAAEVLDLSGEIPALTNQVTPVLVYVELGTTTLSTQAGAAYNPSISLPPPIVRPARSALIGRVFVSGLAGSDGIGRNQIEALQEMITYGDYLRVSTANVSNPPTDAELDSAFGTPAAVGEGFTALVNDNGGNTNIYLVASTGTLWTYVSLTVAV